MADALQHVGAEALVGGGERQRADEGLDDGGEARGGEKDSGEDPHGQHDQVHEAG